MRLRIVPVGPDTVTLWRDIHNAVIPAHPLTSDDVHERRTRNSLTLAYDGQELVGNATIRPPRPEARGKRGRLSNMVGMRGLRCGS